MKCKTCEGKGFTEFEHGLVMVECPSCKGTGEDGVDATYYDEAKVVADVFLPVPDLSSMTTEEEADKIGSEMLEQICPPDKETDASNSGTGQADKPVRSRNPRKPKQPSKRKVKKQA